jgi:hypothetical protein
VQVQVETKVSPEIQEGQDSKDKAVMQEEREEQDRQARLALLGVKDLGDKPALQEVKDLSLQVVH